MTSATADAPAAGKKAQQLLGTAVEAFGGTRREGQEEMARRVAGALDRG